MLLIVVVKNELKIESEKNVGQFSSHQCLATVAFGHEKSLSFGNFSLNFRPNYRKFDSWLPFRTSQKNKSGENREFRAKINLNSDAFVASKVSSEARNGFFVYHYQNKLIFLS